ncbi:MAG: hypothetical protein M5U07_02785 [Xanthobacteraceae bacterium]|nr:hypothetical protein [Xanthobacteraceae bacterium]
MKRFLLSAALVVVSSAAMAQIVTPSRIGNKCWVMTDHRGYGYWESCRFHTEPLRNEPARFVPRRPSPPRPRSRS